jgi:predicted MFS family arabinose efflux permease
MKQELGTALGLAIGSLVYDAMHGEIGGLPLYRAALAFVLSFALLMLLAAFKKPRRER